MTKNTELLTLAIDLANAGYYVFPCKPDKKPAIGGGFHSASNEPAKVKKIFSRNGAGLIGIACEKSGIWAVDVDNKNGVDGTRNFTTLILDNGGELPYCPTQATPTGGEHFIFSYPDDRKINNSAGQMGEGIDTRSSGYICTGPGYTWVEGLSLHDLEPPDAPEWLLKLAEKTQPGASAEKVLPQMLDGGAYWLEKALSKARVGNRNEFGHWLACQLRDARLSLGDAETFMRSYQAQVTNGNDPYTIAEALASLNSAYSQPAREPAKGKVLPTIPFRDELMAALEDEPETDDPQDAPRKPRFTLYTAGDALKTLPPIDWVIDNLIPAGSLTIVFGDAGSKKTYAMIDAAMSIAAGDKWINYDTQSGAVLYVDEEMGHRHLTGRIAESMRAHRCDDTTPFYYTTLDGLDLNEGKDCANLGRMIEALGVRFVVIDALMDVIPGADENSVKEIQPALKKLRIISDITKAAIVVIHHANKKGGYRGTSAIKGAVDLLLEISSEQKSDLINFRTEKPRLIENTEFAGRAVWDNDEFRIEPSEYAGKNYLSQSEEYVLKYLAISGPSSIATVASNADTTSESSARKAVYSITKKSLVYRVNKGGQGVAAIYDLTHAGRRKAQAMGFVDEADKLPWALGIDISQPKE